MSSGKRFAKSWAKDPAGAVSPAMAKANYAANKLTKTPFDEKERMDLL